MRVAILLCLTSCSLMEVRGPGEPPSQRDCTTSYKMPMLDAVGTAATGLLTAIAVEALATPCTGTRACTDREEAGFIFGVPALAMTIAYAASAWVGYQRVTACRAQLAGQTAR